MGPAFSDRRKSSVELIEVAFGFPWYANFRFCFAIPARILSPLRQISKYFDCGRAVTLRAHNRRREQRT
jgi:hypothetical protein